MWVLTCKGTMFTKKVVTATGLYQAIGKGCNENKSSMSLNKMRQNLTKTTALAAVIGVASCLFPAIAQAQQAQQANDQLQQLILLAQGPLLQFSGVPNEQADVRLIEFSLNTSVQDTEPDLNVGEFFGAIRDFRVDSEVPDIVPNVSDIEPGTLRTSRLTIDPSSSEVLPTIPDFDGDNIRFDKDIVPDGTFNNDWLRFDATFPNTPTTLTLFIPSNDPSLINSLSGLDEILLSGRVQAVVSRPGVDRPRNVARFLASNPDRNRQALNFRVATVPEPTATASLLGIGTLGAITLLKRNKRLKKSV
jgi:hypothetical protein